MKTPAGKECKYFFGDYHRGRNIEECRLLEKNRDSEPWKPSLCQTCPVPDILRQNASPNLILDGSVKKGFLGFVSEINEPEIALFGTSAEFVSELQSNQGELFGVKEVVKTFEDIGETVAAV
ncbi:MAG: hypothetical protein AAF629_18500, partial [Chloroflexota bacterium]